MAKVTVRRDIKLHKGINGLSFFCSCVHVMLVTQLGSGNKYHQLDFLKDFCNCLSHKWFEVTLYRLGIWCLCTVPQTPNYWMSCEVCIQLCPLPSNALLLLVSHPEVNELKDNWYAARIFESTANTVLQFK
jgi:hypothetical protein